MVREANRGGLWELAPCGVWVVESIRQDLGDLAELKRPPERFFT